ncbi:hypothetical protein [Baaleninema sp.]|uniref:hypothetical protein n=1 Tax=Baaleninema sp. TaxID=3101197 RepID=UPI003CFD2274
MLCSGDIPTYGNGNVFSAFPSADGLDEGGASPIRSPRETRAIALRGPTVVFSGAASCARRKRAG